MGPTVAWKQSRGRSLPRTLDLLSSGHARGSLLTGLFRLKVRVGKGPLFTITLPIPNM